MIFLCSRDMLDTVGMYMLIESKIYKSGFIREGKNLAVSYNGLWKLLIDKDMKKLGLVEKIGISSSTLAKMGKGETVFMSIMEKYVRN